MSAIELRDIHHSYGKGESRQLVFAGLSCAIPSQRVTAILGRSGCGKSTLLNLLAGLTRPDTGEVRVNGRDLVGMSEQQLTLYRRRHIGIVFQSFNLLSTLSVQDNLGLPLELNGWTSSDASRRVHDVLEGVDLVHHMHRFPEELSGGEQQRVAIARSIVHQPQLVLADEPTGNLDEENGRQAMRALSELVRDERQTLLIVTHSQQVANHADEVLVLGDHGKLLDYSEGIVW